MISFEKLNSKNIDKFYFLLNEAMDKVPFRENFKDYYDEKSFIIRFVIKKMVKIIKKDDIYVGYIWVEPQDSNSVRILDMYIKEEYIHKFNKTLPLILKSNLVTYDTFENYSSIALLQRLHFDRIRPTFLLKLDKTYSSNFNDKHLNFSIYNPIKDASTRCNMQNSIFKEENRVPLTIEDIHYDARQDYYIADLCIFIKYDNVPIGYGQIIYSRKLYTIANFGIIVAYRKKGFGKVLIKKLISAAKEKGIDTLYIRVDSTNIPAIMLYENVGFKKLGTFSSWLWSKEFI